jgi:hypothetical protein
MINKYEKSNNEEPTEVVKLEHAHTHTQIRFERIGSFISTTQNVKMKTNRPKKTK